jgi:hypothetical protein
MNRTLMLPKGPNSSMSATRRQRQQRKPRVARVSASQFVSQA